MDPCPKCGASLGVLVSTFEYNEQEQHWYIRKKMYCPGCGYRKPDVLLKRPEGAI